MALSGAEKTKTWRLKNREHVRAYRKRYNKKWYAENRLADKCNKLRKYGISLVEFDAMLKKQDHACAICFKKFGSGKRAGPCVDHCHGTNKVRALLCINCNTMLGQASDNINVLARAIDYLLNWSAEHLIVGGPQMQFSELLCTDEAIKQWPADLPCEVANRKKETEQCLLQ